MIQKNILLGVNIDHVATLREARKGIEPEPLLAALLAEQGGADGITVHLREDRRHIQDRDVELLRQTIQTRLNLEMAATEEMLAIAKKIKPAYCCLVPEKRQELTTEGGLDVIKEQDYLKKYVHELKQNNIQVSLFIDADKKQIDAAKTCGADLIEIHTGRYCESFNTEKEAEELFRIQEAATYASQKKLIVNAGHGLNYFNVLKIAAIPEMYELNIGHAIVSRAIVVGFKKAVQEMKKLMISQRN